VKRRNAIIKENLPNKSCVVNNSKKETYSLKEDFYKAGGMQYSSYNPSLRYYVK
jgi:hypothetical protein